MRRISKKEHSLFAIQVRKLTPISLCLLALLATSCMPSKNGGGSGTRTRGGTTTITDNSPASVSPNFGRYLKDNPIALSGNTTLESSIKLGQFLDSTPTFITQNQFLINPCSAGGNTLEQCFEVRSNNSASYITATDNKWAFSTNTEEFLQVQAFGNIRDITDKFHDTLETSYNLGQFGGYESAIPQQLFSSDDNAFWFKTGFLKGFSNCGVENNAFYDPAGNSVCLGAITVDPTLYVATDPTVTWHEMGHAFNQILMNSRQRAFEMSLTQESNLGVLFYDEAGSLGEGLSDFYSLFMNDRTLFAEWALGRYLLQSRPLSESESIHVPGLSETQEGRLSYPQYINYDPNEPDKDFEDVHYAGQIPSHFLTAFYKSLMDTSICGLTQKQSLDFTMHLIFETLAELGDQTATGSGVLTTSTSAYEVNHSPSEAIEWIEKNKPITFRRFFQTFSKYFLRSLGNPALDMCNGQEYSRDTFERLLDSYGLLLFKTYNENGNHKDNGHTGSNTQVTITNRVKSQLIGKNLLILEPREDRADAFVIDGQQDIKSAIEALILAGKVSSISSQIDSDFGFNNGNAQISPGEVVGLALNLFNNSNSTMAGVRVLGNDWDHTKGGKPCNNLGDNFPSDSEGAADVSSGESQPGGCLYTTRYNGKNASEATGALEETLAPVCFVEIAEDDATKFVTQDKLAQQMGLPLKNCLGGEDETKDCFIRTIKGADHAFYSRIAPQSTWAETLLDEESGVPEFNTSNVVFMEVSPDIPPGTTFNCRFRATFTNCEDCYHDSGNGNDDYLDYEFSGHKPFKLINFKFTVID